MAGRWSTLLGIRAENESMVAEVYMDADTFVAGRS